MEKDEQKLKGDELDSDQESPETEGTNKDDSKNLTSEELKKLKKKMKKKEKKMKEQETKKAVEVEIVKENEGKDQYEIEVAWCIKQLKLGLTNKGVTKDQGRNH